MKWQGPVDRVCPAQGLNLAQAIRAPGGGFVAQQVHERVRAGTVVLEGGAGGLLRLHGALEDVGFHSGDAVEKPLGLRELLDQEAFRGSERLVLLGEFGEQLIVLGRILARKDDVPSGEAVGDAVRRNFCFPFVRAWPGVQVWPKFISRLVWKYVDERQIRPAGHQRVRDNFNSVLDLGHVVHLQHV